MRVSSKKLIFHYSPTVIIHTIWFSCTGSKEIGLRAVHFVRVILTVFNPITPIFFVYASTISTSKLCLIVTSKAVIYSFRYITYSFFHLRHQCAHSTFVRSILTVLYTITKKMLPNAFT